MLSNPLAWCALIAYCLSILRLLTYRRQGARHRSRISWLAWLFLVTLAGSVVELVLRHRVVDLFDAGRAMLLAIFVFGVRGNVARLLRSE